MSYGLYIGKNFTSDGHAWLAGYGDEPSSHWLEIVPRKELRSEIYNILSILLKVKEKEINNTNDVVSISDSLQKTPKAV